MNPLQNIPTDNLYKFTFIAGLSLILASLLLFTTQYQSIRNKINTLKIEIIQNRSSLTFLKEDVKELNSDISKITNANKSLHFDTIDMLKHTEKVTDRAYKDEKYRAYLEFLFTHKSDLLPFYNQEIILEKTNNEIKTKSREVIIKSDIILEKTNQLNHEYYLLIVFAIIFMISLFFGLKMSYFGYTKWLQLIQKPADEKLRLEINKLSSENK